MTDCFRVLSGLRLLLAVGVAATLSVPAAVHAADNPRPNIVMILVDDLGYGDLSTYGADDLESPNIDRLVESGIRFDNFYANCCVCSPTRASLLTGRYPELAGVPGVIRTHAENSWGCLSNAAVLLPEVMKRAGYDTSIVGKWHLGLEKPNRPNDHGFDHFHGFLGDMMDDYNLSDDPREEDDLATKNRHKFRELSRALRVQIQRGGAVPWQPPERASAP